MLKQQLQDDLKKAMIARDEVKTSVLRMLKSSLQYFEIQKGGAGYEATDQEVQDVIGKEVKKRKESIDMYQQNNRSELAEKEQKELEVLQQYLPQQLSEDEVKKLVKNAVSQTGASGMADIGKVMGVLMQQVKGKADGSIVSKLVKEALA